MNARALAAAESTYPLGARFPRLAERTPRLCLASGPSPVSRLSRLAAHLGRDDIWLKNDGLYGSIYGGNKPRKLQFVLADALRRGSRRILTTGTIGTNHGLATALYARSAGLEAFLLLTYEDPAPENVATLLRIAASGATVHYTRSYPLTAIVAPYYVARYRMLDGRTPYALGPGGSSVLASLGYADAAFELAEQVRAGELPAPGSIVVPLGTGGTVAGLLAGLRLAGLDSRVVAVRVTRAPTTWRPVVARLARSVVRRIARDGDDPDAANVVLGGLTIDPRWLGAGLGHDSAAGRKARTLVADLEGLQLDPVYTSKSMAALIDGCKSGVLRGPVLFWHTYNAIPLAPPDPAAASRLPAALRRLCRL